MSLKKFPSAFCFYFCTFASPKDFSGWLGFSVMIKNLFLKKEIDSFFL